MNTVVAAIPFSPDFLHQLPTDLAELSIEQIIELIDNVTIALTKSKSMRGHNVRREQGTPFGLAVQHLIEAKRMLERMKQDDARRAQLALP